MIEKMTEKIAGLKKDLADQKELLEKSEELNFKPVDQNGELLTSTGCGDAVSVEDHFRWLEQCDEWTKDMSNDEYESKREEKAAKKKLKKMKEQWRPKGELCKYLRHDDDYYLGLADKMAEDFCEKFQAGLDRERPDSIYPEPCEECGIARNPDRIRGTIHSLESQINEWLGYLKNMRNSDYIEDENAENHCVTCAWQDAHSKPFAGPFCAQLETLVNSDTGSCGRFWIGLIPRN